MSREARQTLPPYVAGLLRPEAYQHAADDMTLHETHLSWVILAGAYAYKIRKPVNLGFVDFSTLEQRQVDCDNEVRLNRRLAPDVYLGVVQVTESNGAYQIGGDGRPVEPVVQMRRLPESGMLTALLARGEADQKLLARIARRLARFHASAATGEGVDQFGSLETIRANWAENFVQMDPFVGRTLPSYAQERIVSFVNVFMRDDADLFERRIAAGRIRDGHGDLHRASICVEDGRLQLFDCIEFAPRFRCADVAAEVAFLAMDLEHTGRADLAQAFIDAYMRASGDTELVQLLDFYCCYRAYVRGKVLSLRLDEPGLNRKDSARVTQEARAYFDLAWSHAGGISRRTLLLVMGLPASGKTSLAAALAARLGLVHLSSDVVRKELAGLRSADRSRDAFGQGLYQQDMTQRTYAALADRARRWLRRDRSVVLDATYGRPEHRAAVQRVADRADARLVVLVCRAGDSVLKRRLVDREAAGSGASDARLELWPELRAAFVEPQELPAITISTTGPLEKSLEHAIDSIRARG